jgi:hypothetical protein
MEQATAKRLYMGTLTRLDVLLDPHQTEINGLVSDAEQPLVEENLYYSGILVLQRGFTPVEAPVRCGVCDVSDTPHGFSVVDRPVLQAPTGRQTRAGAGLQSTAARPEVA